MEGAGFAAEAMGLRYRFVCPSCTIRIADSATGVDYPAPMVEHDMCKNSNMARMKAAYSAQAQVGLSSGGTSKQAKASPAKRARKSPETSNGASCRKGRDVSKSSIEDPPEKRRKGASKLATIDKYLKSEDG
jgi:hypothetical protein